MIENIDYLSLYFGEDYKVNDYITVHNPIIGDVLKTGEQKYFKTLSLLTAIPSDMKAMLWDNEINWMEISDFEFFSLISKTLSQKDTEIFFGDVLDFSKMKPGIDKQSKEPVIYQLLNNGEVIVIDKFIYTIFVTVLRQIHNITPKVEIATTKTVRKILIELNRTDIAKSVNQPYKSTLLPLVSTMMNMEGFKYDLEGIKKLPYYAFIDSVKRISVIKSTNALLNGCYSGWIDGSKIDKKNLDWFREFETNKKAS